VLSTEAPVVQVAHQVPIRTKVDKQVALHVIQGNMPVWPLNPSVMIAMLVSITINLEPAIAPNVMRERIKTRLDS